MSQKNIFNIPFGINFLEQLADEITSKYADDPIYFANLTILLPNRRSCRELANILFKNSGGKSLLLPNIMPVGETNEDEILFGNEMLNQHSFSVVPSMRQRMILAELIERWKGNTEKKTFKTQSALLSIELSSFLDEVEKERLSFEKIENLVPDKFSEHWQLTLEFLKIVTINWPEILNKQEPILNKQEPISKSNYVNYLLDAKSDNLQQNGSQYPIIIADSGGAIPAVLNLIKTVSNLENGYIFLHGLDKNISDKTWQNIDQAHPQWQLKRLIECLEVEKSQILDLQNYSEQEIHKARSSFLTNIVLPSDDIVKNIDNLKIDNNAVENFEIVDCPDLYNEAAIIAMKIRQTVENTRSHSDFDEFTRSNKTSSIAVVTNNTTLTKLVTLELKRWNIGINDSTGVDFKDTPQAVFFSLVAKMICDNFSSPIDIVSALKHAFCNCGYGTVDFKLFIANLESQCFRGVRKNCNLYSIKNELDEETSNYWQKIIDIVKPLADIIHAKKYNKIYFKEILINHIKICEKLANSEDEQGEARLYKHDMGAKFKEFLEELSQHAGEIEEIDIKEYPALFEVMMLGRKYNPPYNSDSNITILAPVETRLLSFDLSIICGLNDSSWPNLSDSNPFMNKSMRKDFGLPSTEQRIGKSAHDFCNLLGSKSVFITRSIKEDGVLTVKSRWLSRIETILKITGGNCNDSEGINPSSKCVNSSNKWQYWLSELNKPEFFAENKRASANPPISARPRELSVTYFEKLMRDPYSIYAKKILNLKKLDEIDQDPTMADFGSFIHLALDRFIKQYELDSHCDKYQELLKIGNDLAIEKSLKSHMFKFWETRFEKNAKWFVANEEMVRKRGVKIYSEIDGKLELCLNNSKFTIKARADRVEQNLDGNLAVIDYKTGKIPSDKDIQQGLSPQMTLQGLLLKAGGFDIIGEIEHLNIEHLNYWKFDNNEQPHIKHSGYAKSQTPDQVIIDTKNNIQQLIKVMFFEQTAFIACPNSEKKPTYNEYEHLERVVEVV